MFDTITAYFNKPSSRILLAFAIIVIIMIVKKIISSCEQKPSIKPGRDDDMTKPTPTSVSYTKVDFSKVDFKPVPQEPTTFRCARCGKKTQHTPRTKLAMYNGKRRFYCPSCHRKWQETHQKSQNNTHQKYQNKERIGILPVIIFIVILVVIYILREHVRWPLF